MVRIKRGIFLMVACALMMAGGCSKKPANAVKESPLPEGTDMSLSGGVHFVEVVNGATTWDIRSQRATYSTGPGLLKFFDVKAAYFQNGKAAYEVSGNEGAYDSNKKIITLAGDIFGSSEKGYSLKTQSLTYNLNTEVAETSDRVEIRGQGVSIDGVGLFADFKARIFKIMGGVKVLAEPAKIPK